MVASSGGTLDPQVRWRQFQSPSLRGSGRFVAVVAVTATLARFNPLHCGAVVASRDVRLWHVAGFVFQSPSLRGSGRFGKEKPYD